MLVDSLWFIVWKYKYFYFMISLSIVKNLDLIGLILVDVVLGLKMYFYVKIKGL